MEILIYFLIFITTSFFILVFYDLIFYKTEVVKERLYNVKNMSIDDKADDEFKEPFLHRFIRPSYQRLIRTVGNATPKAIKEKYEVLILTSGTSNKMNLNNVLMIQIMMCLVFTGFLYLLLNYASGKADLRIVFLFGILGFAFPLLSLYSKAEKRKDKIKRCLPDFLDLLYVSVEAGLGFDAALKKTAEKMKGPLSSEILRSVNEIARGKEREESFRALSYRTGVDDVASFVTAVIQTEKLGSNIANMLRIQSVSMRQMRRQRAEEKAARIPVKMLFPLIFLMFPSLFVVILGPALINIIEKFMSR